MDSNQQRRGKAIEICSSSTEVPGSAMANDYDVFLSFRGPDTRNEFADILYEFMSGKGIRVFRDDEELHPGEKITEILHAIERSRLYMPILSRGYATSKWCLQELAHMVECTSYDQSERGLTGKKEILPIFYDVEPKDVKLETELYNEALRMHERNGCDNRMVESWQEALCTVARIKGWQWHLKDQRQGKVLQDITQEVYCKIIPKNRVKPNDLVGIDDRVEFIQKWLSCDVVDVRCVIIHGMGGIGKTTLAKVVFNQLYVRFQYCSFLSNVHESLQNGGMVIVQRKLLSDVFNSSFSEAFDVEEGYNMIRNRLSNKRVLIVFDGVDDGDQLKQLIAQSEWFGSRSRIIITTKDISTFPTTQGEGLKGHVKTEFEKILWYDMKELDSNSALQLFSKHAFSADSPPQEYCKLAREVLTYTRGLPLAIEVIGSSLYGKRKEKWKSTLKKLKEVPHKKVREKLMISYEALEFEAKQIFLDIACFFINKKKTNAVLMWEACKLFPNTELEILVGKSLIKIIDHDRLWMHDLLRDLGRDIVRQEDILRPKNRSRLWHFQKARDIKGAKKGMESVVALALQSLVHDFTHPDFTIVSNIRYLEINGNNFTGDSENTFQEQRGFFWYHGPLKLQANNFMLRSLVVLKLSNYNIIEDWSGWAKIGEASTLKVLKLTGFKFSITPDLSVCLSLKRLILKDCPSLIDIDHSIGKLERLVSLKIKWCPRLQKLHEEIGCLSALRDLRLIQGYNIKALPHSIGNLKLLSRLVVEDSALTEFPNTIGMLVHLRYLSLANCTGLRQLPHAIGGLTSLIELDLSGSLVGDLPLSLINVKKLMVKISGTPIRQRLTEGLGSSSSLSPQRPELIHKDLTSLSLVDYPLSQLIGCGVIQKEYHDLGINIISKTESPLLEDTASEIPMCGTELRRSVGENWKVRSGLVFYFEILRRIVSRKLCFSSNVKISCMPLHSPPTVITFEMRREADMRSRFCEACLQILAEEMITLSPRHFQFCRSNELLPKMWIEASETASESAALSWTVEIHAIFPAESGMETVKRPITIDEIESLVRRMEELSCSHAVLLSAERVEESWIEESRTSRHSTVTWLMRTPPWLRVVLALLMALLALMMMLVFILFLFCSHSRRVKTLHRLLLGALGFLPLLTMVLLSFCWHSRRVKPLHCLLLVALGLLPSLMTLVFLLFCLHGLRV